MDVGRFCSFSRRNVQRSTFNVQRPTAEHDQIARYSQRNNLSTLSEINITPLLDLAFVLLIIFIITTPLIENSASLAILPRAAPPMPRSIANKVQVVSIDRDAAIKFNDEIIDAETLTARLTAVKTGESPMSRW